MDYSSLKVVDLKRELKSRGLSVAGNKDELVERLNTYTQNLLGTGPDIDVFCESMNETDILDEDGVLGDELDYEDEVLKKISSGNDGGTLDLPSDVSVCSNNSSVNVTVIAANTERALPPREPRNQQKVEKKVQLVRNRSLSLRAESDIKENEKSKDDISQEDSENASNEGSALKVSLKTRGQSFQERLEQRKRKFGIVKEEDKKTARAARFGVNVSNVSSSSNKKSSKIGSGEDLKETVDTLKQRAERFGLAVAPALAKTKTLETLKSRAERFGLVSSPVLKRLSENEKKEARKSRFLINSSSTDEEEKKKKLRAERFNIPA